MLGRDAHDARLQERHRFSGAGTIRLAGVVVAAINITDFLVL